MDWCRLWHDMPTDPKWRTIARRSGQSIGDVIAVWNFMMVSASKAGDRGALSGWDDEDVATALDIEPEDVAAIREAMQGKVLDGDRLTGWEKRQPKREDEGAAGRKRRQRERDAANDTETSRNVTQCHASVTPRPAPDKIREEDSDASASGAADAPPTEAESLKSAIFGPCLNWLIAKTGRSRSACAGWLGKASAAIGDAELLGLLLEAKRQDVHEPIAWMQARINPPKGQPKAPWEQKFSTMELLQEIADDDRSRRAGAADCHGPDDYPVARAIAH